MWRRQRKTKAQRNAEYERQRWKDCEDEELEDAERDFLNNVTNAKEFERYVTRIMQRYARLSPY